MTLAEQIQEMREDALKFKLTKEEMLEFLTLSFEDKVKKAAESPKLRVLKIDDHEVDVKLTYDEYSNRFKAWHLSINKKDDPPKEIIEKTVKLFFGDKKFFAIPSLSRPGEILQFISPEV